MRDSDEFAHPKALVLLVLVQDCSVYFDMQLHLGRWCWLSACREHVCEHVSAHTGLFFFLLLFSLLRFHPWSRWRWQELTLVLLSCSLIDASLVRRRLKKPVDVCSRCRKWTPSDATWWVIKKWRICHTPGPLGSASRFGEKNKAVI